MRCTLMRRYSPGPVPCLSAPSSISRRTNSMARYSAISEALNVISLMRLTISCDVCGVDAPQHRIDLHHQHVLGVGGAEERIDRRIGGVAAVPVGHAVDLDRAEHVRQRRRGHHRVGVDLLARKHAQPAGVHIGRRDEQRHLAFLHRVEIDEADDQVLQRIDVERIEIVGRQIAATSCRTRPASARRRSG